jgi:hypothetical protein
MICVNIFLEVALYQIGIACLTMLLLQTQLVQLRKDLINLGVNLIKQFSFLLYSRLNWSLKSKSNELYIDFSSFHSSLAYIDTNIEAVSLF